MLLADAATGKISIYPEKDLKAATARKSILNYLYTTPPLEFLITDKGGEFEKNLDQFLAQYNITLLSISSHQKGSTGIAESNIRLSKAALRRVQIIDPSNWSFSIPLICQGLNETLLYGQVSRNSIYFNPTYYRTTLNLLSLENNPITIFEEQAKDLSRLT